MKKLKNFKSRLNKRFTVTRAYEQATQFVIRQYSYSLLLVLGMFVKQTYLKDFVKIVNNETMPVYLLLIFKITMKSAFIFNKSRSKLFRKLQIHS